ncbi:MAG TPA: hypothetical protein VNN79_04195 [Actinomycetota bacterium]|nr:hypothetical protein [Actinomycetota bacterium]
MRHRWVFAGVTIALLGALATGAPAATGAPQRAAAVRPAFGVDPGDFVRYVTNPFLPFKPGTELVYRGVKDGEGITDRVRVLSRTKTILGVKATVVRDVSRHGSQLIERTEDWYAQDRRGNVWYFGEDTEEFLPGGRVSREGSWQAGVHGAVPGIVMEANPHAPDGYRQELYRGHAEDTAWVLRRGGSIDVPLGTLHHVLLTLEWTRLEPNVIDRKYYAKGFGIVREASATGPLETSELVSVHRP